MEEFLQSLQGEDPGEEGEFTIAADRAEKLLAERMLTDVWLGWLCLLQGFIRHGTRSLVVEVATGEVRFQTSLPAPLTVRQLLSDERLLLGWLNLQWFGTPSWDAQDACFTLSLSGSSWRRYKLSRTLKSYLDKHARYLGVGLRVNGRIVAQGILPKAPKYCFYHPQSQDHCGLRFVGALSIEPGTRARFFRLGPGTVPQQWPPDDEFAAVAYRTDSSWSQVYWVQNGVVIQEERNTLERPGLAVLASVESLGLSTDLAGFEVVADQSYFRFVKQLKKDVLWML